MKREAVTRHSTIKTDLLHDKPLTDLDTLQIWQRDWATTYGLTTLLAHADDGVIWGQFEAGAWRLSNTAFPKISPLLRLETLQECRMFGEKAEVYLWRDDANRWQARLIEDDTGEETLTFDETQILWGTEAIQEKNGFTRLADGTMENQHTPPISRDRLNFDPDHNYRPLRLRIRHYLDTDHDVAGLPDMFKVGLTYIALSRLVALETNPEVNNDIA